jgi:hypothetical protein
VSAPARLAVVLVALLAAGALLLPERWRPVLIAPAFIAGAILERARHDHPPRPPALRDTPAAWSATVRNAMGWPAAIAATVLVAAAGVLWLLHGHHTTPRPSAGRVHRVRPAPLPALRVRRERLDREFRAHGASFRVDRETRALWAREILRRSAGKGHKWITIAVHARNLTRARFDPTRLTYRLRDRHGTAYVGAFRGGTGPRSLAQTGTLARGQAALVQLGFSVPRAARRLTLVFEERSIAGTQIRVPLN